MQYRLVSFCLCRLSLRGVFVDRPEALLEVFHVQGVESLALVAAAVLTSTG